MWKELFLVLVVACSISLADITGTDPAKGSCLCSTANSLNIRDKACGKVIGTEGKGSCYKYKGSKKTCTLKGKKYEFFLLDYEGKDGWAAGKYLNKESESECKAGSVHGGYTCEVAHSGKRIHETMSHTPYDCMDSNCKNTCKGGQCVAYVTCNCKRNGKYAPNTDCWRPGTKVISNGKCNNKIPKKTAIATFNSSKRYYAGHAAVFMGCNDDGTIKVYDQYCGKAVGYRDIGPSNPNYKHFSVIQNPKVCPDRESWPCRVESSGSTTCPMSQKGC